jgi:Kef-type K+ transport system membrane component KefB
MTINTLFYLALILLSGLIFGRLVKFIKLPNVTGYLLAGLILGPYCLKLFPIDFVSELGLVSEMALAFIAFSIGAEFKLSYFKKMGRIPVVIATFAAVLASVLVTISLAIAGVGFGEALVLGAIASATAPAATVMVVKQYRAKGPVTSNLLSVVAIDDAIGIILFGFSIAIVKAIHNPGQSSVLSSIVTPLWEVFGSMIIGAILGYIFTIPLRFFKKESNRIIITVGFVFLASSLASILGLSSLLLCMSMGAVLVNITKESGMIFKLADEITPPILVMFFVISGAELDISILPSIGLIGILYIISRSIGKVFGAYIGADIVKAPANVKKYLGLTLLPQAGVAIGLSLIAAQQIPEQSKTIRTVVLCATFVYEMIGPVATKYALKKAGEIKA